MRRRDFFLISGAVYGQGGAAGEKPREWVTAAASRDTAPRVGLIPSTFAGSEELDGKKIRRLVKPAKLEAALTGAQLEDMLRLAVELGGGRRGGLVTAIDREDWVVVKVCVGALPGADFHPGKISDPRLARAVLRYLAEKGLGRRFTIAEGAPGRGAAWETTWGGEFEGLSYRAMVGQLAKQYPRLQYELVDLNTAPALKMPVEGRVFAAKNAAGMYHVPRVLRECDKVISIAPLGTGAGSGVGLTVMNYLGFAPGEKYGYPKSGLAALGAAGEVALDYYSFHPADYAIVGGTMAGDGKGARRHNVVIAGTNGPAVDAVGAAVMGFESTGIRHLELAVERGYGLNDAYSIWTRGAEIEEVKAEFGRE
jgi:hypothetical protein